MKKSHLIAIIISAIMVLWMALGMLFGESNENISKQQNKSSENALISVAVEQRTAENIQMSITVQGTVEPNRVAIIKSQLNGTVKKTVATEGQKVEKGALIVTLDLDDRIERLEQVKAELLLRQKNYQRINKLSKNNYQSEGAKEEAYAALQSVKANLARIKLEVERTKIIAPFNGMLKKIEVEEGELVSVGSQLGMIIDNSPLIVSAPVAQADVSKLKLNSKVQIKIPGWPDTTGILTYISPEAAVETRTFRVEVSVENSINMPSGLSAELKLPTKNTEAHFLSPALLSLNDEGILGVKTVDENNTVEFNSINILESSTKGVWVDGLPLTAKIITVGQAFVKQGVKVDVSEKKVSGDYESNRQASINSGVSK